ncbi:Surfeit locu protein 1 [Taenia crassiceps]|uniref:SURF1-like protein n=1 Tax=Taenia crassiceps TaxID=6207 RepID=A0ABR4QEW2_9CEST
MREALVALFGCLSGGPCAQFDDSFGFCHGCCGLDMNTLSSTLLYRLQRFRKSYRLISVKASTDLPEFQPITVDGRFDHSREVIVGPRAIITDDIPAKAYGSAWGSSPSAEHHTKESSLSNFGAPLPNGYCIVTPFELKDRPGVFILVNRGWVPTALRDPVTRPDGQIQGIVKITGFIRYNEKPPPLTPDPKTMSNAGKDQKPHRQYFSREVIRISEALNTLPIFIDANYGSTVRGGPIGGQTKVLLRNNHTEYIITWFSLGAISLGMWMYWLFF